MSDLLDRLRKVEGSDEGTHWYRNPDGPEAAAEIERLRARATEQLVHYCVCCPEQETPRGGCDCVCCTTARLEADLAEAEALLRRASGVVTSSVAHGLAKEIDAFLARRSET